MKMHFETTLPLALLALLIFSLLIRSGEAAPESRLIAGSPGTLIQTPRVDAFPLDTPQPLTGAATGGVEIPGETGLSLMSPRVDQMPINLQLPGVKLRLLDAFEIADRRLPVGSFLSWLGEDGITPPSPPQAGNTMRVLLQGTAADPAQVGGEFALLGPGGVGSTGALEVWVDQELTAAAPVGSTVLAFTVPPGAAVGAHLLRLRLGGTYSGWTPLEIADPGLLPVREALAQRVLSFLSEDGGERGAQRVVGPYLPLPVGAVVRDGLNERVSHRVTRSGQWLFYAFDDLPTGRSGAARWLLVDQHSGEIDATLPGDGWPFVIAPSGLVLFDAGVPSVLYGGAFLADGLPRFPGNGLHAPPPRIAGEEPGSGPGWSANDLPFWGSFEGPCREIRKIAVIVQLDDQVFTHGNKGALLAQPVDAFSEKAAAMKATYRALGFDQIHHVKPADLVSGRVPWYRQGSVPARKGLDLDALDALLRQIAKTADCCTEVSITVLSHGILTLKGELKDQRQWGAGNHFLKYAHRVNGELIALDVITTTDLVRMFVEAFYAERKQCVPLSVIVNACHSGQGVKNAAKFLRNPTYSLADPVTGKQSQPVQLIGSSKSCQTTRALPWPGGITEYPFINALRACLKAHPKGLADDKAWRCLLDDLKDRIRGFCKGTGKECFAQDPQREIVIPGG
jgi:hypothetical protein